MKQYIGNNLAYGFQIIAVLLIFTASRPSNPRSITNNTNVIASNTHAPGTRSSNSLLGELAASVDLGLPLLRAEQQLNAISFESSNLSPFAHK